MNPTVHSGWPLQVDPLEPQVGPEQVSTPRQVRKEAGWSQGDLGERIGTDPGRISRYESGRITPSADALVRIAEALDVSLDYLLVDDIPRRPLHTPDHHLGERFNPLEELDEEDLSSLLNHLDGLIAKKRLKTRRCA
ncbi:MAG TPA: helix-turn-helix transcriptional regulator, partial [Acidimicrobiales bacterium]|nr:helix-turn-helix transcriptional regulator [Acidimicrobiales bacterium]